MLKSRWGTRNAEDTGICEPEIFFRKSDAMTCLPFQKHTGNQTSAGAVYVCHYC